MVKLLQRRFTELDKTSRASMLWLCLVPDAQDGGRLFFFCRTIFRAARVNHFFSCKQGEALSATRAEEPSPPSCRARGPSAGPQRQPAGFLSLAEACDRQHLGPGRRGAIQGVQARSWQASQRGSQRPLRRNGNNAGPALVEGLHSRGPQPLRPLARARARSNSLASPFHLPPTSTPKTTRRHRRAASSSG